MADKIITILPITNSKERKFVNPQIGENTWRLYNSLTLNKESKDTNLQEAQNIMSHCILSGREDSITNIAIGYVQSGKTTSFTILSALAADNKYKVIIYLTGTKTNLQEQTFERLGKDLDIEQNFTSYKIFDDEDYDTNEVKNFMMYDGCTLLFPVLKHAKHINNLAKTFQSNSLKHLVSRVGVLIIDDEADQASFNTYARKNSRKPEWENDEFSQTYSSIINLKKSFPCHSYVQYTATPQAALLIDDDDILSPRFHTVLTPGEGYTGGKFFFRSPGKEYVKKIPAAEVYHKDRNPLESMPHSLDEALKEFFISVAIIVFIQKRESYLSMMVHPDGSCISNEKFKKWIASKKQYWISCLSNDASDPVVADVFESFRTAYDEITKYMVDKPSFEVVKDFIVSALTFTQIHLIQGDQVDKTVKWKQSKGHILVGAEMLNRGFTVEKLSMTYMPRTNAGTPNADTIEQRCRFFGYKMNYADVCRIYLSEKSIGEYQAYIDHEECLMENLRNASSISDFSSKSKEMILSGKLKPTRSNIISKKIIRNKLRDWHSFKSIDCFEANLDFIKTFLSVLPQDAFIKCKQYEGNVNREHRHIKLSIDSFIEFFKGIKFQNAPDITRQRVTIQYLRFLYQARKIEYVDLYEMAYKADKDSLRTHEIRDDKVINLMAGRSIEGLKEYEGDAFFKDPNTLSVQLHHFIMKYKSDITHPNHGKEAYAIALHYPKKMEESYVSLKTEEPEEEEYEG